MEFIRIIPSPRKRLKGEENMELLEMQLTTDVFEKLPNLHLKDIKRIVQRDIYNHHKCKLRRYQRI